MASATRVWLDVVASGWVLFPAAAGATAWLAGWAVRSAHPGFALAAAAGVGLGLLALVVRAAGGRGRAARRAAREADAEAARVMHARLRDLDHRLYRDGDPRSNRAVGGLRELDRRVRERAGVDPDRPDDPELTARVDALLERSVAGLERLADLNDRRRDLVTDAAKDELDAARAELLNEVELGVDALVRALDALAVRSVDHRPPTAEIAALRDRLDAGLTVARRVDERVAELDAALARRADPLGPSSR